MINPCLLFIRKCVVKWEISLNGRLQSEIDGFIRSKAPYKTQDKEILFDIQIQLFLTNQLKE